MNPFTRARPVREYLLAAGIVLFAALAGLPFRGQLKIVDAGMVLLLAVVVASSLTRRGPAVLAAVIAIVAFDVGFVPPYNRLSVEDAGYFLTFAVMLAVALVMGGLTARIRENAVAARERAGRLAALYGLSRELTGALSREQLVTIATRHLGEATGARTIVVLAGVDRDESPEPPQGSLVVPLDTTGTISGVVILDPAPPDDDARQTARLFADQVSLALERVLLVERNQRARVEVEAERLRTSLLSSLSHDLRTPLASIEGAASSLLQSEGGPDAASRTELAGDILDESRRMNRLVGNLLDMVRVESGALALKKEWLPLEEPVGVALLRLEERLATHPVDVRLPGDLPFVPIDELLVEQVLLNLLENAIRYTPANTPITISARTAGPVVEVEIADRGPGIPRGEEEAVFRKFYRGASGAIDARGGAGLGLTICRGIIQAHGGRMWAEPADTGAVFRFTLPVDGPAPAVPVEA